MKLTLFIFYLITFLNTNVYPQNKDYCTVQQQDLLKYASEKDEKKFLRTVQKIEIYCKESFDTVVIDSLIKSSNFKIHRIGTNSYKIIEQFQIDLQDIIERSKNNTTDSIDNVIAEKRKELEFLNYHNIRFNNEYFITEKDKKYSIHDFQLNILITDLSSVNWVNLNPIEVSDEFIKVYKNGKEAIYNLKKKNILSDKYCENISAIIKDKKILFFLYDDKPVNLQGESVFSDTNMYVKHGVATIFPNNENLIIAYKGKNEEMLYNFNIKKISKKYNSLWNVGSYGELFVGKNNDENYLLNKSGTEIKQLKGEEKLEALPNIFGPYYIYTLFDKKSIVNEKVEVINSIKYNDIRIINNLNFLFCKYNNDEFHLLDLDLNILSKFKSESLNVVLNSDYDFIFILKNGNKYYAVDFFGNIKSEKFNSIKELEDVNKFKIYSEVY